MKWLGLVFPFLYKYLNPPTTGSQMSLKATALDIYDAITLKSRSVVFISIGAIAGFAVMCGSFFMFLIDSTRQYDFSGVILWNATLTVSSILFLCSIAVLAYVYFYAWPGAEAPSENLLRSGVQAGPRHSYSSATNHKAPSSIENALSLLVLDYVQERQEKRAARYAARSSTTRHRDSSTTSERSNTTPRSYSPYDEQRKSDDPRDSLIDRYPDNFH